MKNANQLWKIIAISLTAIAVWPSYAQDNSGTPTQNIEEVREELDSGIIANPLQRAQIYFKNQDWARLYRHGIKWTREFPGESRAWRYLGQALDGLQQRTEAADAHLRAWDLSDKKDYRIIARIGEAYAQTGDWDAADDSYRKALAIRPNRATLWARLGQIALQRRHPEWRTEAKIILRKILSFGEYINDLDRWQYYSDFLDEMAADVDAPTILTEDEEWTVHRHIVRLDPKRTPSWYRLYEIEVARGNEETVEKIIEVLQSVDPGNPHSALFYGHEALAAGKEKRAVKFFQQALQHGRVSNAQRSEIHMIFGDLEERPQNAIGHYQQAIRFDPSNKPAWEQAIVMLRGMRQFKSAAQVYADMEKVLHKISIGKEVPPEYLQSVGGGQQQIY